MKSTIVLAALTSSTVAIPFAPVLNAMFGTTFTNEVRAIPHPSSIPSSGPIAAGSGTGAFPPLPTESGGRHHHGHKGKTLAIDYQIAPTALPFAKIGKVEQRQDAGSALPSFSLLDPNDSGVSAAPTSDAAPLPTQDHESAFPFPTGGDSSIPFPTGGFPFPTGTGVSGSPFPTDAPFPSDLPFSTGASGAPFATGGFPFPTGGFPAPTGGFSGLPTTLETLTRGPQPTGMPAFPPSGGENGEGEESADGQGLWSWLQGLFGGKSQSSN